MDQAPEGMSVRELRKWLMQVEDKNRSHYQQNVVKKVKPRPIKDKIQHFEEHLCISTSVSSEQLSVNTKERHESFGFDSVVGTYGTEAVEGVAALPSALEDFHVISTNSGKSLEEVFKPTVARDSATTKSLGSSQASSAVTGPMDVGPSPQAAFSTKAEYDCPSNESLCSADWPVDSASPSWDESSDWSADSERPSILPDAIDASLGELLLGPKPSDDSMDYKVPKKAVPPMKENQDKQKPTGVREIARDFGGSQRKSAIQLRKEELEQKWANERRLNPIKKTKWQVCRRTGKYRKQVVLEYSDDSE